MPTNQNHSVITNQNCMIQSTIRIEPIRNLGGNFINDSLPFVSVECTFTFHRKLPKELLHLNEVSPFPHLFGNFGLHSVVFTFKISVQAPLGESAEGDLLSSLFDPTVMGV